MFVRVILLVGVDVRLGLCRRVALVSNEDNPGRRGRDSEWTYVVLLLVYLVGDCVFGGSETGGGVRIGVALGDL